MKRVLLLGNSYIAQKAIIPALKNHPKVKLVGVASKTRFSDISFDGPVFNNYSEAINKSECDTVYVSLHNSVHYEWIIKSLENNKNVICDKPLVLNRKEAALCYKQSGAGHLVFEALPYLHHTQHKILKKIVDKHDTPLQLMSVQFGFPPLDNNNFRNNNKMGGGCIFDLGPYLVSIGEYYFKIRPERVSCEAITGKNNKVITRAAITMFFGEKKVLQGYISFESEYRNHLDLWGHDFFVSLDRAFTTPVNYVNHIYYKNLDTAENIEVPISDSFKEMFSAYANIKTDSYKKFNNDFLNRMITLDAINKAAKTKKIETINYEN